MMGRTTVKVMGVSGAFALTSMKEAKKIDFEEEFTKLKLVPDHDKSFMCECRFTGSYFVHEIQDTLEFPNRSREDFLKMYANKKELWESQGHTLDQICDIVAKQLKQREVDLGETRCRRNEFVEKYKRAAEQGDSLAAERDNELYTWSDDFLSPEIVEFVAKIKEAAAHTDNQKTHIRKAMEDLFERSIVHPTKYGMTKEEQAKQGTETQPEKESNKDQKVDESSAQKVSTLQARIAALESLHHNTDEGKKALAKKEAQADLNVHKRGEIREDIYKVNTLKPEICERLSRELERIQEFRKRADLTFTRPNSMNNYGLIMREVGLEHFVDGLVNFFKPLAALFPLDCGEIDSFRSFTVHYDANDGDRGLAVHYDNAELTFNVNIGGDWTGGAVTFFGLHAPNQKDPCNVHLNLGQAAFHYGKDLHQSQQITTGTRKNLIVWCRSSERRDERCCMCAKEPKLLQVDSFYGEGYKLKDIREAEEQQKH